MKGRNPLTKTDVRGKSTKASKLYWIKKMYLTKQIKNKKILNIH